MIGSKIDLKKEMDDLEDTKKMYQSAYPDIPVWSQLGKKKKAPKAALPTT
jgi:hypothetical protein